MTECFDFLSKYFGSTIGNSWPFFSASEKSAQLMLGLLQLEQSQYWSQERIEELQLKQAFALLNFAKENIPYFARKYEKISLEADTKSSWESVPILKRSEIQDHARSLIPRKAPYGLKGAKWVETSGSTGQPLKVYRSNINMHKWHLHNMRQMLWFKTDLAQKICALQHTDSGAPFPAGKTSENLDYGFKRDIALGQMAVLDIDTDIQEQAQWLSSHDPYYLIVFPSILQNLLLYFQQEKLARLNLHAVMTVGETVSPYLRELCTEIWGCPIFDTYSSAELGHMAIQCPDYDHLHVQAENVFLEVLRSDGKPCAVGETGRIVVTDLHSYMMPLIRYEVGDLAEVGSPCACGRGLPVLKQIIGRERNLVHLPNGQRRWPVIGLYTFLEIAPIRQIQLIQDDLYHITARLAVKQMLSAKQEADLRKFIQEKLFYSFDVTFEYTAFPMNANAGKFEEFICKI